ncbi:nucleotidyltransferase domain-containing protein [Methylococcus mesophilus]|uniref:nucleotidyltransferase domain-containing protein n=1 Tax=Methylococcus mesophilus TaxID=2993564 RepID=UPI00224ADBD4|nr:nucleotidyltransferase domain-containing protein [Methylococcus mesophilus]UZR29314.1 nucleotidyltransferase domain-containing protein [Methylococcus mesophilus]
MRISPQTRSVIRQTAAELFGEEARVVLFGSRTDDDQRGGDIDLLIDLPNIDAEKQRKGLTFVARLQRRLGDQRIDVLVADPSTPELPIYRVARKTGIAL